MTAFLRVRARVYACVLCFLSSKVAVVAGLEALKDAGIVTGEGEEGWMLPGHMRDSTGVMYASSYPALDAAIGEVMIMSPVVSGSHETHFPCKYKSCTRLRL